MAIAKYDLFFHYRDLKKSHFTIFAIQNFVQNTEKHVTSIYIVGIMFVWLTNGIKVIVSIANLEFYLNNGTLLLHRQMQEVFRLRMIKSVWVCIRYTSYWRRQSLVWSYFKERGEYRPSADCRKKGRITLCAGAATRRKEGPWW